MKHKLVFTLILILSSSIGCSQTALLQRFDSLMHQAREYSLNKQYTKSNEVYGQLITEMQSPEFASLIPSIRDMIGLNHLKMGIDLLKLNNYEESKFHLDKAIELAKSDSKTYLTAQSWMGQWYSKQVLNIRTENGNNNKALELCIEAERHFDLARATDRRLNQQLTRAQLLQDLARPDNARQLLLQVIDECIENNTLDKIRGRAFFQLGSLERELEQFQLALQHLELGYNLCMATQDYSYARLSAQQLCNLHSQNIPDAAKAELWKQRVTDLKIKSERHE